VSGTYDRDWLALHRRLAKLERRCKRLAAMLRLFVVLFRVVKPDLSRVRLVGLDKARLLRAVERSPDLPRLSSARQERVEAPENEHRLSRRAGVTVADRGGF
jgi:hypothetical protein